MYDESTGFWALEISLERTGAGGSGGGFGSATVAAERAVLARRTRGNAVVYTCGGLQTV